MALSFSKDRLAGLGFILIGLGFAWGAGVYEMGQLGHMGPGYFPRLLGLVLTALGVLIFVRAPTQPVAEEAPLGLPWRPTLALCLSIAFFSLLLKPLGLVAASFGLVVLAALGQPAPRWREVLLSALVLSLVSAAVFAWGLKLPLPLWPTWI